MILDPVILSDMPEGEYHAHPALSNSGAKRLLPPGCPAVFAYERIHGRKDTKAFDEGHAAHQLILGAGQPIHVVDALDWKKPANQQLAKEIRAEGKIPLLRKQFKVVTDMRNALRRHPMVGRLFDPDRGTPEQSLFWHDERHGIDRRARLDWFPTIDPTERLIIADYKTTINASPDSLSRTVGNFGYHQQHPFYLDGVAATTGVEDALFVFVFQEKTPPYLVTVGELTPEAVEVGRAKNDAAMGVFAECEATGIWPGYSNEIVPLDLPPWADRGYL